MSKAMMLGSLGLSKLQTFDGRKWNTKIMPHHQLMRDLSLGQFTPGLMTLLSAHAWAAIHVLLKQPQDRRQHSCTVTRISSEIASLPRSSSAKRNMES